MRAVAGANNAASLLSAMLQALTLKLLEIN
jgi:hypothetical protein